jgi:ribulose-5-phosphate 4-epimerase/fuculose-1-phosphate aldolase
MNKEHYLTNIQQLDFYNLDILASWNCSIRINNTEMLIKPTGLSYDKLCIENICHIDFKWNKLDNNILKPSSDWQQHKIIYHNNPEVNAIIHTHSHYATILAILGIDIEVICMMHADYFWKKIPCLPFINHRLWDFWDGIYYKNSKVFLLSKHWTISLWKNLEDCIKNTVILEEIAKLYYHTLSIQNNIDKSIISNNDIEIINEYYHTSYWNNK